MNVNDKFLCSRQYSFNNTVFTISKLTIETLKQGVKYVQTNGCSGVFIVNFEQVNAGWGDGRAEKDRKSYFQLGGLSEALTITRCKWDLNQCRTWSSYPEVFWKRAQACNFIKKETLTKVFSCELCEIFQNTFFIEHLRWLLQQNLSLGFAEWNCAVAIITTPRHHIYCFWWFFHYVNINTNEQY